MYEEIDVSLATLLIWIAFFIVHHLVKYHFFP